MRCLFSAAYIILSSVALSASHASPNPSKIKVDEILTRWIKVRSEMMTIEARIAVEAEDRVFREKSKRQGTWKSIRSADGRGDDRYLYVEEDAGSGPCSAVNHAKSFVYDRDSKVVTAIEGLSQLASSFGLDLTEAHPQPDTLLGVFLWRDAKTLFARYDMRLTFEDKNYYYVTILPKLKATGTQFREAQLVFRKDNFHPRRLWFLEPNGNTLQYNLEKLATEAFEPSGLNKPPIPEGWRLLLSPVQ